MPANRRWVAFAWVGAAVAALGACSSGSSPVATPTNSVTRPASSGSMSGAPIPGVGATDWPTFGHDNARTGVAPGFPAINDPLVAWHASLDGAVYGQPLVIGGTVYAATENDTVYALVASSGQVIWKRHLGTPVPLSALPCGNIDPLGITGAMVYDPAAKRVYAVAETTGGAHTLYGLDAANGSIKLNRNVDPPKGDRLAHQQRSALTLLDGRVYIAYGGLAGDCAQYIGSVVGVPTSGTGPNLSYAFPTSREAGIWAPGGGTVAPGGTLLYASGNGAEIQGSYDGSDSVIALDPATLRLKDRFSPSTWRQDNAQDLDLGSMSPAVVGDHVLSVGKRGAGYVLENGGFGGIDGQIDQADVCPAFGTAAVDQNAVYVPCSDGTRKVTIGSDGKITVGWHASVPANGSPVLGGGLVWAIDWNAGTLYGLDPSTGVARTHVDLGSTPHFAAPALAGGAIYVGTMGGVVSVR